MTAMLHIDTSNLVIMIRRSTHVLSLYSQNPMVTCNIIYIAKSMIEKTNYIVNTLWTDHSQQTFTHQDISPLFQHVWANLHGDNHERGSLLHDDIKSTSCMPDAMIRFDFRYGTWITVSETYPPLIIPVGLIYAHISKIKNVLFWLKSVPLPHSRGFYGHRVVCQPWYANICRPVHRVSTSTSRIVINCVLFLEELHRGQGDQFHLRHDFR